MSFDILRRLLSGELAEADSDIVLEVLGPFVIWRQPEHDYGEVAISDGTADVFGTDDRGSGAGRYERTWLPRLVGVLWSLGHGGEFEWREFRVVRFRADGSVGRSFGTDGVASVIPDARAGATNTLTNIGLLPDGRIVTTGCSRWGDRDQPTWFSFARFDADGQLDATFDDDGVATFPPGGCAVDLETQADGSSRSLGTVAARYAPDGHAHVVIVGLTAGGDLDATFATDGIANVLDDGTEREFVRQPDGKFLVVADDLMAAQGEVISGGDAVILARLTLAGVPDTSFGDGGIAITDALAGQEIAHDVTMHDDEHAVVVATVPDQNDGYGTDVGAYRFVIDQPSGEAWSVAAAIPPGASWRDHGAGRVCVLRIPSQPELHARRAEEASRMQRPDHPRARARSRERRPGSHSRRQVRSAVDLHVRARLITPGAPWRCWSEESLLGGRVVGLVSVGLAAENGRGGQAGR